MDGTWKGQSDILTTRRGGIGCINNCRTDPFMVVGWSGSSTDATARVGFISGGAGTTMVSLQDQHLFYGSAGWHLTKAVDINNEGYVVGNGTFEGTPTSWLLVPLQ